MAGGTGCDQLTFNPSLSARPTTTATDSASGVDIDLTVPQLLSPTFPSPSEIKEASLTLPVGFSINPNAADGKTSCTDAAANFGTTEEADCPEFSKVGTDVIDSSALPAPVSGGIYLGDPQPGNRYRILLTASGFGTHIKLAGTVIPDPQTGQLVARFNDLPQSPLTEFNLHFFGAERGVLATPTQCGTYAVHSTFAPWDEVLPSQSATQFFDLDSGPEGAPCPGRSGRSRRVHAPLRRTTRPAPTAPSRSNSRRDDGDQNLSGLKVTTPPGFTATWRHPLLPGCRALHRGRRRLLGSRRAAAPSCPAASQIGTAVAGAAPGASRLPAGQGLPRRSLQGRPLSLVVDHAGRLRALRPRQRRRPGGGQRRPGRRARHRRLRPAAADLRRDPAAAAPIRVNLDRPGLHPQSDELRPFRSRRDHRRRGNRVAPAPHFQVANCAILPFAPKLSLKLTGGVKRRGHPAIHATLTTKPGEANSRQVSVTLPKGELLDNSHIGTVCTRVDFAQRLPGGLPDRHRESSRRSSTSR